jgi:hypothetical protein
MTERWTEAEDEFIRESINSIPFKALVEALKPVSHRSKRRTRSEDAVSGRIFVLGLSRKASRNYYLSMEDLRVQLQVGVERIKRWIDLGLRVQKSSEKLQSHYFIDVVDLEAFALKNPRMFDGIKESSLAKFITIDSAREVTRTSKRSSKKRSVQCVGGFSYPSIAAASKATKIPATTIRSAIIANRPVRGREWKFVD